jgi:NitT/TauT family transport system substrate-binding protein
MKPLFAFAARLAAVAALGVLSSQGAMAQAPIPVRMVALGTGLPFLITTAWKELGYDKKHGFDLQVEQTGNLSNQWIAVRSNSADLVLGNFLDVLRQQKAGLKLQIFQFCYNYDDPIVTLTAKPYAKLADLKGASVGVTRSIFMPVLLYRTAGKKAYGVDFAQEAKISEASPSLLPQMLRTGQLDATYSFRSLVLGVIKPNKNNVVALLNHVL